MDVGRELLPLGFFPEGGTKFKFGTWLDGGWDHDEHQFLIPKSGEASHGEISAELADSDWD